MKFPKKEDFESDPRVIFEPETDKYVFHDAGEEIEYEYEPKIDAWFPRWNEKLVSSQQSAYAAEAKPDEKPQSVEKKVFNCFGIDLDLFLDESLSKPKKRPITSVYVTGLPLDTTEEEVEEVFKKCGTIMPDIVSGKPKIKLYKDQKGILKGDALVTFFKEPSVNIAIDILDDSQFRFSEPGKIRVQVARFSEKKNEAEQVENPNNKKPKLDPNLVKKRLNQLEKKLEWDEEGPAISEKYKKCVVLEGMFTPQEIKDDVTLLLDLKEDIRDECEKVGAVINIKIFENSIDGVALVKFSQELSAQAAVKLLDGRFFAKRQIHAYIPTTKVKPLNSGETTNSQDLDADNEQSERLEKFSEWIEKDSN
ncbi:hypothetical protein BB560_001295 [Smittium megazygosporum]|uniref:RRM domain-containing protein n=1 Tax=Smittium megazygosporum TaxID=133381 RepID=A0A2T9ZHX9_9FUNG|nr:hypothetical protein BB560_001295 [Smittium megazygosporum]